MSWNKNFSNLVIGMVVGVGLDQAFPINDLSLGFIFMSLFGFLAFLIINKEKEVKNDKK